MKIHNDFTLYFRVVPSGKRVVYYYAYDENGKRMYGKSTGETTMTAARKKCNRLLKEGALAPKKGHAPTFAEYAANWWDWDKCDYVKSRRKRYELTRSYTDRGKRILETVLLPYFGKMRMDQITKETVEGFIDSYLNQGYKNSTINSYYSTLKTMPIEAEEREVIARNPTAKMRKLVKNARKIQIITPLEFKKLFVGDWEKIWDSDLISYTANKLAALTGMRASEVLGLKGCYVYDKHIYLCMQHDKYGYRPTKTKDACNLPIPDSLMKNLQDLKKLNGDGYLFSKNGGEKPLDRSTVYVNFHKALMNIGMTKEVIAERKIHLHSWRHFFNTQLLKGGLSVKQTQAVTRHKSEDMTDNYLHFDESDFAKAKEVQDSLLEPIQEKTQEEMAGDSKTQTFTVVSFEDRKTA